MWCQYGPFRSKNFLIERLCRIQFYEVANEGDVQGGKEGDEMMISCSCKSETRAKVNRLPEPS